MRNSGIRYNPATFRKFPRTKLAADFDDLAGRFHELRQGIIRKRRYGLTSLYKDYHHPTILDRDISDLQNIQKEIDSVIATSYGWNDLAIELEHHQTNQETRFTLSVALIERILARLVALNRQRYEEEVTRGQHADATLWALSHTRCVGRASSIVPTQSSHDFDSVAVATVGGETPATAVFDFLCTHDGWHAKANILAATGITNGQWNDAIADLITSELIERQGEKRWARYRTTFGFKKSP